MNIDEQFIGEVELSESSPEQIARQAVKETFAILGVNIDEPKEVEEFRKDLRFGSSMRKFAEKGQLALFIALCGGLAAALWTGVKMKLTGAP